MVPLSMQDIHSIVAQREQQMCWSVSMDLEVCQQIWILYSVAPDQFWHLGRSFSLGDCAARHLHWYYGMVNQNSHVLFQTDWLNFVAIKVIWSNKHPLKYTYSCPKEWLQGLFVSCFHRKVLQLLQFGNIVSCKQRNLSPWNSEKSP